MWKEGTYLQLRLFKLRKFVEYQVWKYLYESLKDQINILEKIQENLEKREQSKEAKKEKRETKPPCYPIVDPLFNLYSNI